MTKTSTRTQALTGVVAPVLAAAIALAFSNQAASQEDIDHRGFVPPGLAAQAPKIAATSSTLELLAANPDGEDGSDGSLELLRASFEVSRRGGADLLVRADGECAAWIAAAPAEEPPAEEPAPEEPAPVPTAVVGTAVTAWIELDGQPVAVNDGGGFGVADDGTVVVCNSSDEADLGLLLQDTEALIAQFERDRSARGFTWVVPEVAPGFHEVVVKARLDVHTEDGGETEDPGVENPGNEEDAPAAEQALGVFGKRLLVVERTGVIVEEQDPGES